MNTNIKHLHLMPHLKVRRLQRLGASDEDAEVRHDTASRLRSDLKQLVDAVASGDQLLGIPAGGTV